MTDRLSRPSTNAEAAESNWAGGHELAPDSISAEDRHAAFVAGLEQGRELAEEEMARIHRLAFESVQRHANGTPFDQHQAGVRAHQIAAGERNRAAAVPWPTETAPWALMMPSGYASGAGLPPMWGN
jgi:hypothetical protein